MSRALYVDKAKIVKDATSRFSRIHAIETANGSVLEKNVVR